MTSGLSTDHKLAAGAEMARNNHVLTAGTPNPINVATLDLFPILSWLVDGEERFLYQPGGIPKKQRSSFELFDQTFPQLNVFSPRPPGVHYCTPM